jgi:hypothetical protein
MLSHFRLRIETKSDRTPLTRVHRRRLGPVLQAPPGNLRRLWRNGDRLLPKIRNRNLAELLGRREQRRPKIRRRNSDEHEIRIPLRPAQCLLFGFKKAVDDESATFDRGLAGAARGFAADDRRACIDREQGRVRQRHSTAVRNAARIDCAMAGSEAGAGRTDMAPRPAIGAAAAAGPIDGDAGENGLLAGKPSGRQWQKQCNRNKESFHEGSAFPGDIGPANAGTGKVHILDSK